ncbi:MAG: signal peptidase I [Candidatus Woesearchaeota archaeon]
MNWLKKFWKFLWHDDSFLSWVTLAIIVFVMFKFVLYPLSGVIFGTSLPVVAVISESMEHRVNIDDNGVNYMCGISFSRSNREVTFDRWWAICGSWYEQNTDITKEEFSEFRFSNGFNKGDIIFARGKNSEDIEVGDVIIFATNQPVPIIHRVIEIFEEDGDLFFATKGDNNADVNRAIGEHRIHEDNVLGVASFRVPWLGYFRVWLGEFLGI